MCEMRNESHSEEKTIHSSALKLCLSQVYGNIINKGHNILRH